MVEISLIISVIAIAIAFISLLWNIVTKIMNDRHILYCYAILGHVVGGNKTEHVISISITNASKFNKFINPPMLSLFNENKKFRKLIILNYSYGPINESNIELAPGKSATLSAIIGEPLMEYFKDLSDKNVARFVVSDSLKHRYLSNKLTMKEILTFYNKYR